MKVCGRTSGPGEGGVGEGVVYLGAGVGYRVVEVDRLSLSAGGLRAGPCDAVGAQLERFSSVGGTVAGVVVFDGIAEQLEGRRC